MYNVGANSKQLHLPNDLRLAPFHVSGIDGANSTIQDKGIIVSTCVRKTFETFFLASISEVCCCKKEDSKLV